MFSISCGLAGFAKFPCRFGQTAHSQQQRGWLSDSLCSSVTLEGLGRGTLQVKGSIPMQQHSQIYHDLPCKTTIHLEPPSEIVLAQSSLGDRAKQRSIFSVLRPRPRLRPCACGCGELLLGEWSCEGEVRSPNGRPVDGSFELETETGCGWIVTEPFYYILWPSNLPFSKDCSLAFPWAPWALKQPLSWSTHVGLFEHGVNGVYRCTTKWLYCNINNIYINIIQCNIIQYNII